MARVVSLRHKESSAHPGTPPFPAPPENARLAYGTVRTAGRSALHRTVTSGIKMNNRLIIFRRTRTISLFGHSELNTTKSCSEEHLKHYFVSTSSERFNS